MNSPIIPCFVDWHRSPWRQSIAYGFSWESIHLDLKPSMTHPLDQLISPVMHLLSNPQPAPTICQLGSTNQFRTYMMQPSGGLTAGIRAGVLHLVFPVDIAEPSCSLVFGPLLMFGESGCCKVESYSRLFTLTVKLVRLSLTIFPALKALGSSYYLTGS